MLGDISFYSSDCKMNLAVADSKEIFGENQPYIIEYRLDGDIIIFNDHFIRTAREAMTTDCMAKMNEVEVELFQRFIEYQDGSEYRDISQEDNEIVAALDQWFIDDINCIAHPTTNACYDSETHTWDICPTTD